MERIALARDTLRQRTLTVKIGGGVRAILGAGCAIKELLFPSDAASGFMVFEILRG